jgi:hypothetical protein
MIEPNKLASTTDFEEVVTKIFVDRKARGWKFTGFISVENDNIVVKACKNGEEINGDISYYSLSGEYIKTDMYTPFSGF